MMDSNHSVRLVAMLEYDSGLDAMRLKKICPHCGTGNPSSRTVCSACGEKLPEKTVYDFYRSRNLCCGNCGYALPRNTVFCPQCGARMRRATVIGRRAVD